MLVVSSIQVDPIWKGQLHRVENQQNLQRMRSAVNKVAVEQNPIILRRESADLQCSEKIVHLAVNITNDGQGDVLGNFDVNDG